MLAAKFKWRPDSMPLVFHFIILFFFIIRSQEGNSTPVSGRNWQYSSEGKELRRPPIRPDSAQGQMQTGTGGMMHIDLSS